MYMEKRKFSKEGKLSILKEASEQGVKYTIAKHGIYPATYYSWKKKFEIMGEAGGRHGMTPEHLKEILRLEKENALLKRIVAEKEPKGRLKDEIITKKYSLEKKRISL